ncbi:hypothetical protein Tco_1576044 [Tanacetum coccineum]
MVSFYCLDIVGCTLVSTAFSGHYILSREFISFVELDSGDTVSRNVLTLYIPSPFVIVIDVMVDAVGSWSGPSWLFILVEKGAFGLTTAIRERLADVDSHGERLTKEETMMKAVSSDPNALDNTKSWKRLGFYHAVELDEEGFDVYFQVGLRSDEHFNAQEYWLSISREENLSLSRSQASTIRNPVLRWCTMINLWLFREAGDLDTTTLRKVIDSEGRLIPEDSQSGVPRVAIPRPSKASMQDLYERMGSMEIRQGAIERMSYRQSYHWYMYAGVFEHMAGVYSVPL